MSRAGRAIRWLNVPGLVVCADPLVVFFAAWVLGALLALASMWIGCGWLVVAAQPSRALPAEEFSIGFMQQLNYGPWLILPFFCPLLLYAAASAVQVSHRDSPSSAGSPPSLRALVSSGPGIFLGFFCLLFSALLNWPQSNSRDNADRILLGWHQSGAILDSARIQNAQAIQLGHYLDGRTIKTVRADDAWREHKFVMRYSLIPRALCDSALLEPGSGPSVMSATRRDSVLRLRLSRPLSFLVERSKNDFEKHAIAESLIMDSLCWRGSTHPSRDAITTLYYLAKTYQLIWQAVILYFAFLVPVWGIRVVASITPESIVSARDGFYGIGWAERTGFWLMLAGTMSNVFSLLRYCSNVFKGSFLSGEQWWSLLLIVPALSPVLLGIVVQLRILRLRHIKENEIASKPTMILAGLATSSTIYLAYLVTAFLQPGMFHQIRTFFYTP